MNRVAALRWALPLLPIPLAWREIGRREIRGAGVFGLVVLAYFIIVDGPSEIFHEPVGWPMLAYVLMMGIKYQIWAFSLMLSLVVADRAVDRGAPRIPTYALAVAAGCAAGTVLATLWVVHPDFGELYQKGELLQRLRFVLFWNLTFWPMFGASAGFLYAELRHARQTRVRLEAAEFDRAREAKAELESRLSAMQARVEPQFLFDTLAKVRKLYDADAVRADRMLDDLITYLRAAMPRMREASSTVGQELDLARSYLAIVAPRPDASPGFATDIADRLAEARMPPMLLLPLIDLALAPGVDSTQGTFLRIAVTRTSETLRLALRVHNDAFARGTADESSRALRDRLLTLYGPRGRLVFGYVDTVWTEAVVEIPCELPALAPPDGDRVQDATTRTSSANARRAR